MNLPPDRAGRLAQRLREAHALLDEQPSAKVRAAILQAAARRNPGLRGGQPERARTEARSPGWLAWRPGWRFSLPAGASVLAGVLAVAIGLRVEREQPGAAPAVAPPVVEGKEAPAAPVLAPSATAVPRAAEQPRAAPVREGVSAAGSAAGVARPRLPASADDSAVSRAAPMRLEAPQRGAAPAAVPPPRSVIPDLLPGELTDERTMDRATNVEPPGPRARSLRPAGTYMRSPEQWLRFIAGLRAAQRDAEAEEELARFSAAYPGVVVPQSLQRH